MTVSAPKQDSPLVQPFPVGGRPQEWRALEEAAAFDKWFDHQGESAQRPAVQNANVEVGPGEDRSTGGARAQLPMSGGVVRPDPSIVAFPWRNAPEVIGGAPATPKQADTQAIVAPTALARPVGPQQTTESSSVEPMSSPLNRELRWSELAVTAVVDGLDVRIRLRDFRMTEAEVDALLRLLSGELASSGYRARSLVLNGEQMIQGAPRQSQFTEGQEEQ